MQGSRWRLVASLAAACLCGTPAAWAQADHNRGSDIALRTDDNGAKKCPAELTVHPQAGTYDVQAVAPDIGAIIRASLGLEVDGQTLWADAAKKATWNGDASGKLAAGQSAVARYEFAVAADRLVRRVQALRRRHESPRLSSEIRNSRRQAR